MSQVAQAGSESQIAKAAQLLSDARRGIYRILADGDDTPDTPHADRTPDPSDAQRHRLSSRSPTAVPATARRTTT